MIRSASPRSLAALLAASLTIATLGSTSGCATSPLGRKQLMIHSDHEMNRMGIQSFEVMKQESPRSTDVVAIAYVECVAYAVIGAMDSERVDAWEVVLFDDESANAFALPGRKIGVHTGLLLVATDQHQLATVLGHEVGHVIAGHSNERVSQAQVAQASMVIAGVAAQASELSPEQMQLLGLMGLGVQVGILLPYSRIHESEADLIGLDLMAEAGFEPAASVVLWQNMGRGGGAPPELLSTHPSNQTRIRDLRERIPEAERLRYAALERGVAPSCRQY
jgi:predicted Zn-dependent protease